MDNATVLLATAGSLDGSRLYHFIAKIQARPTSNIVVQTHVYFQPILYVSYCV